MSEKASNRLIEIDALRGLAALAVVLFHYTTRFVELFYSNSQPTVSFSAGHYGVNLFFIISGFVIFMTLDRTTRPMDFVVSRFSRLFPAYWVAIVLTFLITHLLGLPGKLVDVGSAICNFIMIHGLFRVPHVDSVYWTLEVELLFYCGMFLLYRLRLLHLINYALVCLLGIRLLYFFMERDFGIALPWVVFHLLILKFIPWFSLGIAIYLSTSASLKKWRLPACISGLAIITLYITESPFVAGLSVMLGGAVFLASSGRASLLRHRLFVWLGSISYSLYLLHENIGWSLQLQLQKFGIPFDLTVLIALFSALILASLLTRIIEKPVMNWIRDSYRRRMAFAK